MLGESAALSGQASAFGEQFKCGAQLYFDCINARGDVAGRQLELQSLDDGYEPDRCSNNDSVHVWHARHSFEQSSCCAARCAVFCIGSAFVSSEMRLVESDESVASVLGMVSGRPKAVSTLHLRTTNTR